MSSSSSSSSSASSSSDEEEGHSSAHENNEEPVVVQEAGPAPAPLPVPAVEPTKKASAKPRKAGFDPAVHIPLSRVLYDWLILNASRLEGGTKYPLSPDGFEPWVLQNLRCVWPEVEFKASDIPVMFVHTHRESKNASALRTFLADHVFSVPKLERWVNVLFNPARLLNPLMVIGLTGIIKSKGRTARYAMTIVEKDLDHLGAIPVSTFRKLQPDNVVDAPVSACFMKRVTEAFIHEKFTPPSQEAGVKALVWGGRGVRAPKARRGEGRWINREEEPDSDFESGGSGSGGADASGSSSGSECGAASRESGEPGSCDGQDRKKRSKKRRRGKKGQKGRAGQTKRGHGGERGPGKERARADAGKGGGGAPNPVDERTAAFLASAPKVSKDTPGETLLTLAKDCLAQLRTLPVYYKQFLDETCLDDARAKVALEKKKTELMGADLSGVPADDFRDFADQERFKILLQWVERERGASAAKGILFSADVFPVSTGHSCGYAFPEPFRKQVKCCAIGETRMAMFRSVCTALQSGLMIWIFMHHATHPADHWSVKGKVVKETFLHRAVGALMEMREPLRLYLRFGDAMTTAGMLFDCIARVYRPLEEIPEFASLASESLKQAYAQGVAMRQKGSYPLSCARYESIKEICTHPDYEAFQNLYSTLPAMIAWHLRDLDQDPGPLLEGCAHAIKLEKDRRTREGMRAIRVKLEDDVGRRPPGKVVASIEIEDDPPAAASPSAAPVQQEAPPSAAPDADGVHVVAPSRPPFVMPMFPGF